MHISWKPVALFVILLFALSAIGYFFGESISTYIGQADFLETAMQFIFVTGGFAYASLKLLENRWSHMIAIAIACWIISFPTVFVEMDIFTWVLTLPYLFLMMAVGGLLGTVASYE